MPKKYLKKKHRKLILRASLITILSIGAAVVIVAERKFSQLVLGGLGEGFSTRVYSAPFVIRTQPEAGTLPCPPRKLVERLNRLGYQEVSSHNVKTKTYQVDGARVVIGLNGFDSPFVRQAPQDVAMTWSDNNWTIEEISSQRPLDEISLEPELVTDLSGPTKIRRDPAGWEEIPVRLADAVLAAEDAGFYGHWGLSPKSIARAFYSNLTGKPVQGGSTITQQLAKNFFLTPKRTIRRKIMEAIFAFYLELRFSKEKILTMYLNHIYMGQEGSFSIAGVKAAAKHYFGRGLNDLSLSECAVLAGLIRSPYRYNPERDPERSILRRNYVLDRMALHGFITTDEADIAKKSPLQLYHRPKVAATNPADYYVAEVVRQLTPRYGEDGLHFFGMTIYTSMDPLLQQAAAQAVKKTKFQGALVSLNPHTGDVRALVGGQSFQESQFNRATQAYRQPGSAFKPFVFGAALEAGITTADLLNDEKKSYPDGRGGLWHPKNYDDTYRGSATLRDSLAHSLNAATLDLINLIGPGSVIQFAQKLGVESPLDKSLALALGASEVTLIELTASYAAFNNGGFRVTPRLVTAVTNSTGEILEIHAPNRTSVLTPALSSLLTSLLQSVVQDGTAKRLPAMGFSEPCAGKTGTTDNGRDAWFIGYTSELLTGVWVGGDQGRAVSVVGSSHALPIWADFMKKAYHHTKAAPFQVDKELRSVKIDPLSGKRSQSGCPSTSQELFLSGTEPQDLCPLHSGGAKGWFKKWFGKRQRYLTEQP